MKLDDIAGAIQDILGIPIKNKDRVYSHITEVKDGLASLKNLRVELGKTLQNGNLDPKEAKKISNTIKNIEEHERRINKIIDKAYEIKE